MGYRLVAHSRYAATTDDGQAAFIRGAAAWSPLQLLRFPVDAQVPISILASQDFPASHAEGITAMAIAVRGVNAQTPAQLEATVAAVRDRWRSAPDPARALAVIGEAELARLASGWPAVRKVLLEGIRRDRVRDPLLQRFFAGSVSIACAHTMETAERWLYATDPLIAMTDREPNAVYLRGSALMAARRWSDAVECLLPLATERFGGPLAPDPREVLSALFQAADLADNSGRGGRAATPTTHNVAKALVEPTSSQGRHDPLGVGAGTQLRRSSARRDGTAPPRTRTAPTEHRRPTWRARRARLASARVASNSALW